MKGRWRSNLAQLLFACLRRTREFIVLTVVLLSCSALAAGAQIRRDEPAVAALEAMSTYLAGLDRFVITGTSLTDTRLDAGLIAANPAEIAITVDRPNSLYMKQFNGERTLNLYVHNAVLNLYDSAAAFYAGTEVPPGIDAGIEYALEELDIEMPLADLIHADVFTHLVGATDEVIYLSDKSRVDGIDCHHVAIRLEDADVQVWIQQGQRPLPRQIMITSKWEGGAPRFTAFMNWDISPDIPPDTFRFQPPEGAEQIKFVPAN